MPAPGSKEWRDRVNAVAEAEQKNPESLFYLSFAGEGGFIGGAIVMAKGITTAVIRCYELGINPGGEVLCFDVPVETAVPIYYRDRLLSREELVDVFGPLKTIREWDADGSVN